MFRGEGGDGAQLLGVEQEQQAGDTIGGRNCGVVEQFSCIFPAFLAVKGGGGSGPTDGAIGEPVGVSVLDGPADEVAGLHLVAHVGAGDPAFEIGLTAAGQCQVLAGEPVEEAGCSSGVAADVQSLEPTGLLVLSAESAPQSSHVVPDHVAVQQLPFLGIGA